MKFSHLNLAEPLLRAVANAGYTEATPVQAQAIPHVLEGRDLLGSAQTGTGKTAAFALPILHRLLNTVPSDGRKPHVRVLVLCPTRELANQIADDFRTYSAHLKFRICVVYGGVNQNPQVNNLRRGVDILVATPGRLLDLMGQGAADLRHIETLVLDEADRMLDMGFIQDIRKIVSRLPAQRQTLLFSATMPGQIRRLAEAMLKNPANVQIAHVEATRQLIDESVYFVARENKPQLLAHLVEKVPMSRSIVFTRTKHGADRVVKHLQNSGIGAEAIHSNKSQNARQRALTNFKSGKIPVLVATDIASRGIDVDNITHVVNYDLTHEPETYLHRIGRTGRAGATGSAISFCDREEMPNLRAIERLIQRKVPVRTDHPAFVPRPSFAMARPAASHPAPAHRPHHAPHSPRPENRGQHRQHAPAKPQNSWAKPQHAPGKPAHSHQKQHAGRGVRNVRHPLASR